MTFISFQNSYLCDDPILCASGLKVSLPATSCGLEGSDPPPPLFSYIHGLMSNGFIGKATCVDRTWQFPPPSVLLLRTRPNSHILLVRTRARGSARGRPRGRPLGRPREDHGDGLQRIQRLYRESRKFLRPVDTSVATVGGDERDTTVTT